jgi:hypothetical protein
MFLDLIDLSKLRRAIVYSVILALVLILQDLFIARITIRGVTAMLVPAAVVAIGLFEGGPWGGFLGLAAGYFCDMGYSEQQVLFTVLFPMVGFFSGVLGKYLLNRSIVSYMFLFLTMIAVITACQMFPFLFFTDTDSWAVWRTGLIQIFWSLPWAIPLYFPIKSIAARPL